MSATNKHRFVTLSQMLVLLAAVLFWGVDRGSAQTQTITQPATVDGSVRTPGPRLRSVTPEQRKAAAVRAAAARQSNMGKQPVALASPAAGGTPEYFGTCGNYANSPIPAIDPVTKRISGGMRKFVDTLPGLGPANANNLGQYIPIAVADTSA